MLQRNTEYHSLKSSANNGDIDLDKGYIVGELNNRWFISRMMSSVASNVKAFTTSHAIDMFIVKRRSWRSTRQRIITNMTAT